jgi:hypothetical protein
MLMRRAGTVMALVLAAPAFAASERQVIVINETDAVIEYLYAESCVGGGWGADRLAPEEVIEPGARRLFKLSARGDGCCYDFRAKLHTGASRQKHNVDLCRESEWVVR